MINISNVFIKKVKSILKDKGLSNSEYVFCIICNDAGEQGQRLEFLIVPLITFENNEEKLPFKSFALYKKGGCWFSSENGSFFHLVSKRITVNKKGEIFLKKSPSIGLNSLSWFIGQCLLEHLKNEKLTRKELSINLKIPLYKLNLILSGKTNKIDLGNIINISREFQGCNKIKKYFVLFEKFKN